MVVLLRARSCIPPNERHARRGPTRDRHRRPGAFGAGDEPMPGPTGCGTGARRFTSGAALTARLSGSLCRRPRSRTLTVCAHRGAAEENIECGATRAGSMPLRPIWSSPDAASGSHRVGQRHDVRFQLVPSQVAEGGTCVVVNHEDRAARSVGQCSTDEHGRCHAQSMAKVATDIRSWPPTH
jgi:hypothetical protein